MNINTILEMAAADADRPVVTAAGRSLTAAELSALARRAAGRFRGHSAVLYLGVNHLAYPVALFGSVLAGVPFVPLNYRLGAEQLGALVDRHPGALVLRAEDLDDLVKTDGTQADTAEFELDWDGESVAVIIYTSGTTAAPKAALLRHRHLMAYILNTLEFGSAASSDATLVSVPPYHIAGLTNLLSNLYTGRRIVYLTAFDPREWLEIVRAERVTHAMLVPTMLARIVGAVDGADAGTPGLRSLAYGGSRTPRPVLERALRVFPHTGFVNAYGLTETASSIALLGPEEHRTAFAAADPAVRARLGSVGRALPGIEIQIRTEAGELAEPGATGLVFARGAQVSGEYGGRSVLDAEGWFPTRDLGYLDAEGYLFIEGRADDTIIRGGENIAPAEIEDVLLGYPGVTEAAVIGVPDPEWGQRVVAVLVGAGDPEEIKRWVKGRLRSSKTPDAIVFRPELPKTETGKLLRRNLVAELESTHA
ncbi:class I adenylate-forming enzyme family protein [Nocardia goodfellowii]|uniref:Acyl-CoA synthetase (AMP-forming)/AMP-acid ligase II n=1 Tax=Nocardia goodfellowii TaxID=882446 RepID=A0ABS4QK51_9NOCA|nr:class I adenylate-forming enzyme family protein [Nocardia goodfellowii]MBP2191953.1 acyl-CoA synthetase (AMP-forming)/AMP-acid ligase II [Nocardia goodfellowii]